MTTEEILEELRMIRKMLSIALEIEFCPRHGAYKCTCPQCERDALKAQRDALKSPGGY